VYRVSADAELARLRTNFNDGAIHRLALNQPEDVAVVITRLDSDIEWGAIASLQNTNFVCTAAYIDRPTGLLFVFSSDKEERRKLLDAIDPRYQLFQGKDAFRCLNDINRLLLLNLGLRKAMNGPVRYRQYIGADVGQGIREQVTEGSYAAMVFGVGYSGGRRVTIGCSPKGRVWARDGGRLHSWVEWCKEQASKLTDATIDVDQIFEGILFPEQVEEIPTERAIVGIDWSDFFFSTLFERTTFWSGGISYESGDSSLKIESVADDRRQVTFALESDDLRLLYVLSLDRSKPEGYSIQCASAPDMQVTAGNRTWSGEAFLQQFPPVFWLDNTSCLVDGCLLITSRDDGYGGSFISSRVQARDWSQVDIRCESQGPNKIANSIQRSMINDALSGGASVVFDDDNSGEMADVVTITELDKEILFTLVHCKYSSEDEPGARIKDLYELVGQAQKSIKWAASPMSALEHMRRREQRRRAQNGPSRFERGDLPDLARLRAALRIKTPKWEIVLVQPGLSQSALCVDNEGPRGILRVLGATQAYLSETYGARLTVIVNQ